MTCVVCKAGRPQPGTATATFRHQGRDITIRSVPAQVCPQCGELYYDEATSRRLLDLIILAASGGATSVEYTRA